jgi:hypothetical protein
MRLRHFTRHRVARLTQKGISPIGGAMTEKILINEIIHSVGWDYFDELLECK